MPRLFEEEKVERCFLSFSQQAESIHLYIVDHEGERVPGGHVLSIHSDGTLYLNASIDKDSAKKAGILTDRDGRIIYQK